MGRSNWQEYHRWGETEKNVHDSQVVNFYLINILMHDMNSGTIWGATIINFYDTVIEEKT